MTHNRKTDFCSKILLFGEYSIIRDSMALSIPYDLFSGHLDFSKTTETSRSIEDSKQELRALANYIDDLQSAKQICFDFDLSSFKFDTEHNLFFSSTIPIGHGLGSSAALCAALNDRYGVSRESWLQESDPKKYLHLKEVFAQMESHFHGSSSGIDPLISYSNEAILIESSQKLGPVKLPKYDNGEGAIFLLNTGRPRRTEPLVNLFLEKSKRRDFQNLFDQELIPANNDCIVNFLEGQTEKLFESFGLLSGYQFDYFSPMIPKLLQKLWKVGLDSNDFYLKLCGAGGGGVFLGIAKDFSKAQTYFESSQVRVLFRL